MNNNFFSSSRSQSSSETSRSPSPATARRRRYDSHQSKEAAPSRYNKSPGRRPHHGKGARSPTPKRRHSPGKKIFFFFHCFFLN